MSVDENKIVSGSKLSAEVEPFIPSQFRNGLDQNNIASNPTVLQQLPSYMTNCYPFVQETTRPVPTRWQTQHPQYIGPHLSVPPPPPPPQTNIVSMYNICNPTSNPNYQYKPHRRGLQFTAMPPYTMLNTNHFYSVQPFQGTRVQYRYCPDTQSNVLNRQSKDRIAHHKSKTSNEVEVSQVKQKPQFEIRSEASCIIEKEKCIKLLTNNLTQTDFSETISDLTLAEKPSPFFKNVKQQKDILNGIEDSESDSGYSSPLNRKTVTNVKKNSAGSEFHDRSLSTSVIKSEYNYIVTDSNSSLNCSSSLNKITDIQHKKIGVDKNLQRSQSSHDNPSQDRDNKEVVTNNSHAGPEYLRQTPRFKARSVSVSRDKRERNKHITNETPESNLSVNNIPAGKKNKNQRHNKCDNENTPHSSYPGLLFLNNSSPKSLEPVVLKLEDEKEYPQLESNKHTTAAFTPKHQKTVFSYSDALKRKNTSSVSNVCVKDQAVEESVDDTSYESNTSVDIEDKMKENRRWRKQPEAKKDQQQQHQQSSPNDTVKKRTSVKSKTPLQFNFSDLLAVLKKQQEKQAEERETRKAPSKPRDIRGDKLIKSSNPLDSTPPAKLRGKERETPAKKRPSALKKVILKEREERKQLRHVQEQMIGIGINLPDPTPNIGSGDATENCQIEIPTPKSAEMSPASQLSPNSISPVSPGGSPSSSESNSPVAGSPGSQDSLKMKLHSRRFREYCNQMLDKDIDASCTALLQDLVRFQDRLYHKDPIKARSKRRLVLGLREVTKHLKLRKLKCIIISPNLERIQSKGGLDDALSNIIKIAQDQNIPFVFALGRRALGQACSKLVPVSCVGVFNYEGSEGNFKLMIDSSEKAREAYHNMVTMLENVSAETTSKQLFAHLGHSRTPSTSSAISFTNSITSETVTDITPGDYPEKHILNASEINPDWDDNHKISQKTWTQNDECHKTKGNQKRISKWIKTSNC